MLTLIATSRIHFEFLVIVACAYFIDNVEGLSFVEKGDYNRSLQVKTYNGILQGFSRKTDNGKDIFLYQKIPFAKPPLYALRFMSPQPPAKWSGVLDARLQSPPCIQMIARLISLTVKGSEDCLYLNVFSPVKPQGNETFPVLFWIHGGAFLEGDSTHYDPEYFLDQNVVVVTANYRLGLFGFLSTQDEASPGNYALKDQNAVLRWIRKNIRNFGGDPNRVTIMGESAGACSVMHHMVSPKSRGLFHGAVAMSGDILAPWCNQRHARDIARDVGVHFGLSTDNTTILLEALRRVDSQQLVNAQTLVVVANSPGLYHNGLVFTPVIEINHKDAFITELSYSLLEKGKFAKVPLIMGTTSMEFNLFKNAVNLIKPVMLLFDLSPSLIPIGMNIPSFTRRRLVGLKIKNRYFQSGSMFSATDEELMLYFSDVFFVNPITKSVQLITKHMPVYKYVFDYEGQTAIDVLDRLNYHIVRDIKGVGHAEDIAYIWKNVVLNEKDKVINSRVIKIFTNFIKYGNPTPVVDELFQNVTWPPIVTSDSAVYLHIGENLSVRRNYRESYIKFWAELVDKYSQKPLYTY